MVNVRLLGGIGDKCWGKSIHTGDRVYDSDGVAVAITAAGGVLVDVRRYIW